MELVVGAGSGAYGGVDVPMICDSLLYPDQQFFTKTDKKKKTHFVSRYAGFKLKTFTCIFVTNQMIKKTPSDAIKVDARFDGSGLLHRGPPILRF